MAFVTYTLLAACGDGGGSSQVTDDRGSGAGTGVGGGSVAKVVLDRTPASKTTDPHARFEFHAEGASKVECAIDGAAFQVCQSPLQLPLKQSNGLYQALSTGSHGIRLRAVAADGRVGESTQFDWTVASIFEKSSTDFAAQRLIDGEMLPLLASQSDAGWKGIFRVNCEFDRAAYDDPIVFPGMSGMAHLHMFWGAKNVDAATDFDALIRSPAAGCSGGVLNRSAYWFPALLAPKFSRATGEREVDGNSDPAWEVVMPKAGEGAEGARDAADAHEVFYYSAAVDDLDAIQSPPIGLRIIAGDNSTQPGQQQPFSVARVSFHYAFPVLPSQVDPKTKASTGWRLASDDYTVAESIGGLSLHGDWFNGWHPEAMDALVKHCIQGRRDCHDGNFAWLNRDAWKDSVSLGRLIDAKGTQAIPEIINAGMGSGHHHP